MTNELKYSLCMAISIIEMLIIGIWAEYQNPVPILVLSQAVLAMAAVAEYVISIKNGEKNVN